MLLSKQNQWLWCVFFVFVFNWQMLLKQFLIACFLLLPVSECGCQHAGCLIVGSFSLYFHEACSIKSTIPLRAPYCPPVPSTRAAVSCTTPYWLYIIPALLSLGFLFVFPDALPRRSHWDYKEMILRVALDTRLGFFKSGGRWLGLLNQYGSSSI